MEPSESTPMMQINTKEERGPDESNLDDTTAANEMVIAPISDDLQINAQIGDGEDTTQKKKKKKKKKKAVDAPLDTDEFIRQAQEVEEQEQKLKEIEAK